MSSNTKNNLTKRLISALLAIMLITAMIVTTAVSASAEANASVNEMKSCVMQVRLTYTKNNVKIPVSWGSSFLINQNTILSSNHIIDPDTYIPDEKVYISDLLDALEGGKYKKASVGYDVVVNKDVTISCTLKKSSAADDYAILTLNEPIGGRAIASIANSDDVQTTAQVYALGFPDAGANMTYTSEDVTITEGIVQKLTNRDGTDYIQSAASLDSGNSGGPLVDENGHVIGINRGYIEGGTKFYYSVSINQITSVLDALLIDWTKATEIEDKPTEETKPSETEETKATETETSAPVVEPAPVEPKGPNMGLIIGIIALVVILIAVVIVIIVVSKKKSGPKPPTGGAGNNVGRPTAPPTAPQRPGGPYAQPYNRPQMPQGGAPTMPSNDGAGETSVLNEGAGETTVLGGIQATGFTLIRKAGNIRININKPEFTLGKERRRVDYCIDNNSTVSRAHAKIKVRAGVCYISDLGSSNGTFVNGAKLSPNQEVALNKGDKIKLSDEEFELA